MPKQSKILLILFMLFVIIQGVRPVAAAENHDELFVLIGDSLMKAKAGDQASVSKNIEQFAAEWAAVQKADSKQAKKVDQQLKEIQSLLAKENADQTKLSKSLSALSASVVLYDEEQNPTGKNKDKVKQMQPLFEKLRTAIAAGDQASIKSQYQALLNQWNASEKVVHDTSIATYGNIEKYMALIRIAITQDPADLTKAETNVELLKTEVDNFLAGKSSEQEQKDYQITDLMTFLGNAEKEIMQKDYQSASNQLNEILTIWPMVEGDVSTRDAKLYADLETKVPTAISILNSENVNTEKATSIVKDLSSRLEPLTSKTDYSIWDAALILLREGLEGLLIVVTLLAFLKKIGQTEKQKWIWAGVAAGVLASAVLAIIINLVFSKLVAGSSRELVEGITGVVAVIMMLTIGAWLHNKSSIVHWNKFIHTQMQQAIAKGSLVSFALISFLSVFREGAETIIFYTGITPYISLQQLILGVVLALVILGVVGFILTVYSVKIPIRLFFQVATILIYFLAFKILGISIHALQVSNMLSTSTVEHLPFIDWIGLYPTWETTLTQVCLLGVILVMTWTIRKRTVTTHV